MDPLDNIINTLDYIDKKFLPNIYDKDYNVNIDSAHNIARIIHKELFNLTSTYIKYDKSVKQRILEGYWPLITFLDKMCYAMSRSNMMLHRDRDETFTTSPSDLDFDFIMQVLNDIEQVGIDMVHNREISRYKLLGVPEGNKILDHHDMEMYNPKYNNSNLSVSNSSSCLACYEIGSLFSFWYNHDGPTLYHTYLNNFYIKPTKETEKESSDDSS